MSEDRPVLALLPTRPDRPFGPPPRPGERIVAPPRVRRVRPLTPGGS
jgi:hypothetical protein